MSCKMKKKTINKRRYIIEEKIYFCDRKKTNFRNSLKKRIFFFCIAGSTIITKIY